MHKIEILITTKRSDALKIILDELVRHSLGVLKALGFQEIHGAVLYDVPEEKED